MLSAGRHCVPLSALVLHVAFHCPPSVHLTSLQRCTARVKADRALKHRSPLPSPDQVGWLVLRHQQRLGSLALCGIGEHRVSVWHEEQQAAAPALLLSLAACQTQLERLKVLPQRASRCKRLSSQRLCYHFLLRARGPHAPRAFGRAALRGQHISAHCEIIRDRALVSPSEKMESTAACSPSPFHCKCPVLARVQLGARAAWAPWRRGTCGMCQQRSSSRRMRRT